MVTSPAFALLPASGNESQKVARDDAGHHQRQKDQPERLPAGGVKVARCNFIGFGDAGQAGGDGEIGEGDAKGDVGDQDGQVIHA